jgi:phosphopantetheinyl transferase
LVRVRCTDVPTLLAKATLSAWLVRVPEPRRLAFAARVRHGTGLASLSVLALLASLADVITIPPLERLRWTAAGKPRFARGPAISLAHSRGFAACAVAARGLSIGIDLEPVGRASAAAVALIADGAERRAIARGAMSPTGLWTVKEAVLKAAGAGLAEIRGVSVRDLGARFAGIDYGWRHLQPGMGLIVAVAAREAAPVVLFDWLDSSAVFG